MPATFTVEVARAFDRPAEAVFAHGVGPGSRQRGETLKGGGMRYAAFDTREDGREEVVVPPGGAEAGRMIADVRALREGALAAVQGRGVFGGAVTTMMQTLGRTGPDGAGWRVTGTSQMVVLGEGPSEAQVRAGWGAMLARLAADLEAHAPRR